jgi:uncharacterized alpha-E superfamily protein
MLSRVANALLLIGRSIERAEHVARVVDVTTNLTLDGSASDPERRWKHVVELCRAGFEVDGETVEPTLADTGRYLAIDDSNPGSALACLTIARETARSVRESISSESWEQINRLYWQVVERAPYWTRNPHDFFQSIKTGCHLLHGIIDDTMVHDEGWHFLSLGRMLERLINTVQLIELERRYADEAPLEDPGIWAAVLKSCSAFEAYKRGVGSAVTSAEVIKFLTFGTVFPRSSLYCAVQVTDIVRDIGLAEGKKGHRDLVIERLAGRVRSTLEFADPDLAANGDGDGFFESLKQSCRALETAIPHAYFLPGRESRPGIIDFAPQQQQQQ